MKRNSLHLILQAILFLVAFGYLITGMAFFWGLFFPWFASALIGAILISASIALFWIVIFKTYRALVGVGLASLVFFGGIGIHLLRQDIHYGEFCLYAALLSLWIFFLGLKWSTKKNDYLPFSVQALFGLILTFLLIEGIHLVIPISSYLISFLHPGISILYGWALIGCAFFFAWGLILPTWENGYPLLYALVAFDLLIIGPFTNLFTEHVNIAEMPFFFWASLFVIIASAVWAIIELARRLFVIKKLPST